MKIYETRPLSGFVKLKPSLFGFQVHYQCMKVVFFSFVFLVNSVGMAQNSISSFPMTYEAISLAKEASQVESEFVKKLKINYRPHQIYFGKLLSIFYQHFKSKDSVSMMSCSRYEIKDLFESKWQKSIYAKEICEKNRSYEIAKIIFKKDSFEVDFFTPAMQSVIGLPATFLQKTAKCTVQVKNKSIQSFVCNDLVYTKTTTEVLHIKKINYQKDVDPLITMEGLWVVDINNEKSIDVKVPLVGAIEIKEKQIRKPVEKIVQAPAKSNSTPTVSSEQVNGLEDSAPPDQTPTAGEEAVPLDRDGRPEKRTSPLSAQPSSMKYEKDLTSEESREVGEDYGQTPHDPTQEELEQMELEAQGMGAQDPRSSRSKKARESKTKKSEVPQMRIENNRMQTSPVE